MRTSCYQSRSKQPSYRRHRGYTRCRQMRHVGAGVPAQCSQHLVSRFLLWLLVTGQVMIQDNDSGVSKPTRTVADSRCLGAGAFCAGYCADVPACSCPDSSWESCSGLLRSVWAPHPYSLPWTDCLGHASHRWQPGCRPCKPCMRGLLAAPSAQTPASI